MPPGEEWLHGEIQFNPGLVAIIGNKGSGKSALADCLGLLGSSTTSEAFSFLHPDRFLHPKTGRAQFIESTLHWYAGDPNTRFLSEAISTDEVERVKYLPQSFVEKVCNDLATPGGGEFERELKKVIFSKVRASDRFEKRSLDELVDFQTHELREASKGLITELASLSEKRETLEAQLNPTVRNRRDQNARSDETSRGKRSAG
jgi:energy-coupling factor transporter ATP-binding protein EcfA2